jgi:transcriptional regulator with GAF, ATPase, and Fis domain
LPQIADPTQNDYNHDSPQSQTEPDLITVFGSDRNSVGLPHAQLAVFNCLVFTRKKPLPSSHPGSEFQSLLVELAARGLPAASFLKQAVALFGSRHRGVDQACIVQGIKGAWRELAVFGKSRAMPAAFLAEALDCGTPLSKEGWSVAPLTRGATNGMLLLAWSIPPVDSAVIEEAATAIGQVLTLVEHASLQMQRARRLAAMLEMTVRWNQTRRTDELLQTMAETSTRLLEAERATIFLLDASGERLIGRPALGIKSGELIIDAKTGVVGQVVLSGKPRRVDEDIAAEQAEVNREVGVKVGFETRSLLCVPMFGTEGKVIGAFELLNKIGGNFTAADEEALAELAAHAATAIANTRQVEELNTSRRNVADEAAARVRMIGESETINKLQKTIARVAETELAVLVLGENGTGKEVVAQLIHYLSPRRDNVLVAVNCAAITETLLESELFGHERGAFTDAHEMRQGKFELANGGTLFLDEIGDMSPGGQARLLRVLEEKVVVRVGGSRPIPVDVRVIAATNQDLGRLVRDKKFREDLYFRLNVVTLNIPPLRDRGEDILMLGEHFLNDFALRARRPRFTLTAAARKALLAHSWPGNVRELRNMMERLAYLSPDQKIDAADLTFIQSPENKEPGVAMDLPLTEATRLFQIDYIEKHVRRARNNMTDAAERLGLHRSNLYRKMKQLGIGGDEEFE